MNTEQLFWLNDMGYVSIVIVFIGGYLIVSENSNLKLLAIGLYVVHNLIRIIAGVNCNIDSMIMSGVVFGILTIINLFRILKQKHKKGI